MKSVFGLFLIGLGMAGVVGGLVLMGTGPLTGQAVLANLSFVKETHVSVAATSEAEVSRFDFDPVITRGESINISVEVSNTGSVPITTDYDIEIYDENVTKLYTYPTPEATLNPGQHQSYTVKHTPHKTGSYTVSLVTRFGGTRSRTSKFLFVAAQPEPEVPEPQRITIVRRQIEWVSQPPLEEEEEPALSRSWRVDAPQSVVVPQGGSTTVPITVTSMGTGAIENVGLTLQYTGNLSIDYSPKLLFRVAPNASKTFALTFSVADGTLRNQSLSYAVASRRLTQSGEMTVRVLPSLTIKELRREVERLELLIVKARAELRSDEREGLSTESAAANLDAAETALEEAATALNASRVEAARADIGEARTSINDAFHTLFTERSQRMLVRAPLIQPVYVLLLAAVLIAVGMVVLYYRMKEKYERRPKLLREAEA